jgi:predicted PurR-regulated permease PerM
MQTALSFPWTQLGLGPNTVHSVALALLLHGVPLSAANQASELAEVGAEDSADLARSTDEMPLPTDLRTLLLLGIFVLLSFYTLYFTREIAIPIVFAFVLNLLLQPAMRALTRLYLPRTIAALLMILVFFGTVTGIGISISSPAANWIAKAPESLTRLEQRLSVLKKPLGQLQEATKRVENMTQGGQSQMTVVVENPGLSSFLLLNTQSLLTGLGLTIVLLFFLLVAGDMFLRRLVEIIPKLRNKKQLVDISQEIERNISGYLFTITLMNAAVGMLTGLAAYLFGMSDAILWGVAAFLLNYLPIFGPLLGTSLLFLAGLVTFDSIWQALLPAAAYLVIHIIEGETITPMLLARRFILNPVLVIISIIFWYWMWGIPGALLAVPVLAATKIICDRIRPLAAFGHFLGTEARS